MILAIVCVGESYKDEPIKILSDIERFINNGWEVNILTDNPNAFPIGKVHLYKNKIFSYVDKLLFTFNLIKDRKESVVYVDHNWLSNLNDTFISEFEKTNDIIYFEHWGVLNENGLWDPIWKKFNDYSIEYFKDLIEYFNYIEYDYSNLITIRECFLHIPYSELIDEYLIEIEKIKPVLEYIGIKANKGVCSSYGKSEGLALAIIIDKFKLNIAQLDSKYLVL
jgi:hypothetical protein